MTECFELTRGRMLRATLLDDCGAPVEGPESSVVTECVARVTVTEVSSTRSDEVLRTDAGATRVHIHGKTTPLRYSVDVALLGANPRLLALMANQPLVRNAQGDVVGNDITVATAPANFALEVWTNLARPVSGNKYGWTLLPRLRGGRVSNVRFANSAVNFGIIGATTLRSARWGTGPYSPGWDEVGWDMVPWDTPPTAVIGSRTHWRTTTTDYLPTASCGAQPLDLNLLSPE